jgi:hypothetical protein
MTIKSVLAWFGAGVGFAVLLAVVQYCHWYAEHLK